MRLDKFLADSGFYTRSEAGRLIRRGGVTVNGAVVKDPSAKIDENTARITAEGRPLGYTEFRWLMLNKPEDTTSTTEEEDSKSVMKLLPPEFSGRDMFPCGRLDIDTTGLLLITDDGQTAHNLLSPKHHCEKTYRFTCLPVDDAAVAKLENGIELSDFTSKPCTVNMTDPEHGEITVTEGKYHQIKLMLGGVHNQVTYLKRVSFAGIELDEELSESSWRYLTAKEVEILTQSFNLLKIK